MASPTKAGAPRLVCASRQASASPDSPITEANRLTGRWRTDAWLRAWEIDEVGSSDWLGTRRSLAESARDC